MRKLYFYCMRFFRILALIVSGFLSLSADAQYMDTLRRALNGKKSVDFRFTSRNSFVDHERVEVLGLKLGVNFGKKIAVGAGYCWLSNPLYENVIIRDADLNKDTAVVKKFTMGYTALYADYIFFKNKRWQYSVPLQFGIGKMGFSWDYNGKKMKDPKQWFVVYEPEVNVKYKFFSWLGVEATVGYRIMLKNNRFLSKHFNSPLIAGGVIIYWNELALLAFPKNKLVQEKLGPSDWR